MSVKKAMTLGTAAAMCLYGGSESVFEVGPFSKAILVDWEGVIVSDKVYGEGKYYKLPWFQRPVKYHFNIVMIGEVAYKEVPVKVRVLANPVPDHLPNLYRIFGDDYDRFMEGTLVKVFHDVSQNTSEQLHTEQGVLEDVRKRLAERLDGLNITIDKVLFEKD